MGAAAAGLLGLLAAGCSDAHLYGKGLDNTAPDRLGLTGRVCTEDARDAGFPVKVFLLVDTAMGPMFSTFDTELARLRALSETVSRHSGDASFTFAVASFGPYARLLAPTDGTFTRSSGELENAIATLGLGQGCLAGVCRDYSDGLSLAQSVIEGDLADLSAGERVRTQYVVVMLGGGPPDPLGDSWAEATDALTAEVIELRDDVREAGALSFSLHTLFLAAPDPTSPDPTAELDATENLLQQVSFVGAGRFERFDSPDATTLDRVGLLKLSSLLEAKSLLVTNLSALPGLDGPVPDADRDGLATRSRPRSGPIPWSRTATAMAWATW
jgi:hypothetical protein